MRYTNAQITNSFLILFILINKDIMYVDFERHRYWFNMKINVLLHLSLRTFLVEKCLFIFVALRPMSTSMVIAGRSVHLTTLFPGQA